MRKKPDCRRIPRDAAIVLDDRRSGLGDRIEQLAAPVVAVNVGADPIARRQIFLAGLTDSVASDGRLKRCPLHQR